MRYTLSVVHACLIWILLQRLARAVNHEDKRENVVAESSSRTPIQQIVYYQAGIGTEKNPWSQYVEGKLPHRAQPREIDYAYNDFQVL